jgi:hydroxypyruvate reductase
MATGMDSLRADADTIIRASLDAAMPFGVVQKALSGRAFGSGRILLLSVGKAAWRMAKAAGDILGSRIDQGIVITKYDHSEGALPNIRVFEAGHPVPDQNGVDATAEALKMTAGLQAKDTVLFLLSGGGSALFEQPLVPLDTLQDITSKLLKSGADIAQVNCIRKRLSAVKGGRLALLCAPATVLTVALSDVLGDDPSAIASGPAVPDPSTSGEALKIAQQYGLELDEPIRNLLAQETPKMLANAETVVAGSVRQLCAAAMEQCRALGYDPYLLTDSLRSTAQEAGRLFGSIAQIHQSAHHSLAFIAGGETVVKITGDGLGGRNQELALTAAKDLNGVFNTALFSIGSDGTDGPTDAAGGYVDTGTAALLREKGIDIRKILSNNDSFHALEACGGLIVTGPTGTNLGDLAVLLIRRPAEV